MYHSNKYASECLGEKFSSWQQITVDELLAYMGFMILMGIVQLPAIQDYWKTTNIFHYMPVASRISRTRFFELHRYLHFVDNSTLSPPGSPGYDRLGKIAPIIAMLSDQFAAVCNPGKEISVDEAMIPFKGRSSLKQYLPLKPIKRGIKVWMRADAVSGYVSAFQVYSGKKGNNTEKGLGSKVVKHLTEDLQNTYRHVYFDNYFASVDLALDLHRAGLYSCATLRSNRKGFPLELKGPAAKGLKERGDSKTFQNGPLTVSVWQDSRPVTLIATNSDPTAEETVKRKKKNGTSITVKCPTSVAMYGHYMGGVDRNDQLRGYYRVRLKCRKYYKYIFWFLFDLAITNAYILHRSCPGVRGMKMKDFRVTLANELIDTFKGKKKAGRPAVLPPAKRFCQEHFPIKESGQTRRRCHYCYKYRHERHDTPWHCKECQLSFCHTGFPDTDCFLIYHTRHLSGDNQ